jgi:hypothetical protein
MDRVQTLVVYGYFYKDELAFAEVARAAGKL